MLKIKFNSLDLGQMKHQGNLYFPLLFKTN